GTSLDNIQVICQPITGNRAFGQATTTAAVGGGGGNPATLSCPAGYVMTGLTGRVGNGGTSVNDQIAAVCDAVNGGPQQVTASVGGVNGGSIGYFTTCLPGLVVVGIQGGAGNLVDRTQIKCR